MCVRLLQMIISSASAGSMRVVGASPFLAVEGTYNTTSGAFDLTATGVVAGFSNILMRFRGTIDATGNITGTVTFGETGGLPSNQGITYRVATRKG
jgi:hypothetical protein